MRWISLLLLLSLQSMLKAQESTGVDSLHQVLADAKHDSTRFKALLDLAGEYLEAAPDSAYYFCTLAREIAERTQRPGDVGEVEGWLGYLDEQRGRIPQAIAHYRLSLEEAERLHDQQGISVVLNNLAAIYKDQGLIDSALSAHARSLAIRKASGDSSGIATSFNNIGLILYDQGRIPEAMENFANALGIYERLGDQEGTATALHNIAGIHRDQGEGSLALTYFMRALEIHEKSKDAYAIGTTEDNIGGVLELDGQLDKALRHYRRALLLHERADDPRGMGYSLRNIAGVELKRGSTDSALVHAREAYERLRSTDDKRGQASAQWMQGLALNALGRPREAEEMATAAITAARELGYPQILRDAARLLSRIYREQGRWREALEMQDLFTTMRDTLLNEEARRSALRQEYRYAYEKKEADLQAQQTRKDLLARERLQKEKNRRNVFLLSGLGVLLVAGGLWNRLRYTHRAKRTIEKEKARSDDLLLNILPAEVAEELKLKGEAEAKHFDSVTILFSDFKGFTQVSEQLSPRELVEELNTCFKAFDRIITARGIEKIKTIGDAYMCAGGLPDPTSSSPTDVVHAALEMQAFMKARKTERDAQSKPAFEMRVGIHTGPVVAGIVGVKKFSYDIWGDTVNIASRMESSGEVGQVNISEATHALVKDGTGLTFMHRGKVQAKGKGELEMYFVARK